jgi:hypothetical protein
MGIIKLEMFKSKEISVALDISPSVCARLPPKTGIMTTNFRSYINIYLWKQDISIEDSDRERGALIFLSPSLSKSLIFAFKSFIYFLLPFVVFSKSQ